MKARDVMVSPVVTVMPNCSVKELAQTLLKNHISAVPVVDDQGRLVGIVSEGDLLHRSEAGTQRRRSPWLRLMTSDKALAAEYVSPHSGHDPIGDDSGGASGPCYRYWLSPRV
jgi:CBS-domain-containing membrane protein